MNNVHSYDVVVVGAGPVGLLVAAELAQAGVRVVLLERDADEERPIKEGEMGARSLNAPSVIALHRRGLLPQVRDAALFWWDPDGRRPEPGTFAGQFAGIGLRAELLDPADPDIGTHVLGAGVIAVGELERILRRRAEGLGAEIRFAAGAVDLDQDADGVTARTGEGAVRASWLVGCDGGRSTVRKRAGIEFPGCPAELVTRQALIEMTAPERLLPGGLHATPSGSYILGGWQRRLHPTRLVLTEPGDVPVDRDEPVTATELEDTIRRITGIGTTVTAIHAASRYSDTTRQAPDYRLGRVLLAGDAAHVHPPAGGQGLNLGIGDAMNLGWKLAATVGGWAPDGLIDSYTAERHPVGAWVQDWTKAQSALARHDDRSRALHGVVADLLESTHAVTYVMKKISGVAQQYAGSPDHPLIGRPMPEIDLMGGGTTASRSHPGRFLLVLDEGATPPAGWGSRLDTAAARTSPGAAAVLVRPDGYVGWAGEVVDGPVLARWLGPQPSTSTPTTRARTGTTGWSAANASTGRSVASTQWGSQAPGR